MQMLKHKKGLSQATISGYIELFLLVVVLFIIVSELLPEAQDAGDTLNESGIPLGGFFAGSGVLWLIIAAGLIILIYKSFMGKK